MALLMDIEHTWGKACHCKNGLCYSQHYLYPESRFSVSEQPQMMYTSIAV